MSLRGAHPCRTICEVLREAYELVQEDTEHDAEVRLKLAEAGWMAKRIAKALYECSKVREEEWWDENKDYEEDLLRRINQPFLPPSRRQERKMFKHPERGEGK